LSRLGVATDVRLAEGLAGVSRGTVRAVGWWRMRAARFRSRRACGNVRAGRAAAPFDAPPLSRSAHPSMPDTSRAVDATA